MAEGGDILLDDFGTTDAQEDAGDYEDILLDDLLDEEETSFGPGPPVTVPGATLDDVWYDNKRTNLVNSFYEELDRVYGIRRPIIVDYNSFKVVGEDLYLVVSGKEIRISSSKGDKKFISVPTIAKKYGGSGSTRAIYGALKISDYKLPSKSERVAERVAKQAQNAAQADNVDELVGDVSQGIHEIVASAEGQDLLPLRELMGLDKALRSLRGAKAVQESKIVSTQQLIESYREDLEGFTTLEQSDQLKRELQKAEDTLKAAQASVDAIDQQLRSQFQQIKETISAVLDKNKPLAERLRILFREQGVTLVSIITALGFIISTLVLALTGGAPTPTPTPPPASGAKEWVKKHLQALGRLLSQLAGRAAAALPGIIGGIISWLLNLLGKTASWLAGNLWALVVGIGGLLLTFVYHKLKR